MMIGDKSKRRANGVPYKRRGPKKKPRREYAKGRWTEEEKLLFLVGLRAYGKGKWKEIGSVLTTRSSVQIKSHGQKLVAKQETGEDIYRELNEYERMAGTRLRPSTPPGFSGVGDFVGFTGRGVVAPGKAQPPPIDNGENIPPPPAINWTPKAPPAVAAPVAAPVSRHQAATPSRKVTIGHFGTENPISFSFKNLTIADPANNVSTASSSFKHSVESNHQGLDMQAAMVLCQLGSADSKATEPEATATSHCATSQPSFSSVADFGQASASCSSAFELVALPTLDNRDLLAAFCSPVILQPHQESSKPIAPRTDFGVVEV